jgi:transcriptional regulator with XRE-family HTH domain
LRTLRKRNGLTLDELSARCVHLDPSNAPSVSYLSMVETGKRTPSSDTLAVLAKVFGKDSEWFLDRNTAAPTPAPDGDGKRRSTTMPLEPTFLFSKELLQNALPELLVQTGTSARQFARLLVRVWQESRQNDFPDIERAAENIGRRRMPLSVEDVLGIARDAGLTIRWFDEGRRGAAEKLVRARFEAPATIHINRKLRDHEARLKYTIAFFIGHRIMHNGDGVVPPHSALGTGITEEGAYDASMAPQDVLLAWRDFECSAFAGALLCPRTALPAISRARAPRNRRLRKARCDARRVDAAHDGRVPVSSLAFLRRLRTGLFARRVSRERHSATVGQHESGARCLPELGGVQHYCRTPLPRGARPNRPVSQISVMRDGDAPRLYCCHSLRTRDAADQLARIVGRHRSRARAARTGPRCERDRPARSTTPADAAVAMPPCPTRPQRRSAPSVTYSTSTGSRGRSIHRRR